MFDTRSQGPQHAGPYLEGGCYSLMCHLKHRLKQKETACFTSKS